MIKIFKLDIVSPEEEMFSGSVQKLFATGIMGELEILFGHAPLLTSLSPGPIWIKKDNNEEEGFAIFGGILEVQPKATIILADSALRAEDIDQASAESIKQSKERSIANREENLDYAKARSELATAIAQLRLIQKIRKKN